MFARPRKADNRQKIGQADHSFMRVAKPLLDHSKLAASQSDGELAENPLGRRPNQSRSSSAIPSDKQQQQQQQQQQSPSQRQQRRGEPEISIGYGHSSQEVQHRPRNLVGVSRADQQEMAAENRTRTAARSGDQQSYSYNLHGASYIDKRAAVRMYRVLCVKHHHVDAAAHNSNHNSGHHSQQQQQQQQQQQRIVFDPLDGRIFSVGSGFHQRVSHNVLVYDNKRAAMSERLPPNQVGAAKSGNGLYPRILCSFDVWGHIVRRYGGGSSMNVEHAKMVQVVEYLDPPYPVPKRQMDTYMEPFFFTTADYTPTSRMRSDHNFKVNRFFQNE